MAMKVIRSTRMVPVIDFATSIVASIGIYDMPIVSGVSTAQSNTKHRGTDDLKITRINIKFFLRKHKTPFFQLEQNIRCGKNAGYRQR